MMVGKVPHKATDGNACWPRRSPAGSTSEVPIPRGGSFCSVSPANETSLAHVAANDLVAGHSRVTHTLCLKNKKKEGRMVNKIKECVVGK